MDCLRMHECDLCEKSFICELDKHVHNAWLKNTRLGMIRKTLIVTSNKGGCGLTLFTLLLAAKIKHKGYKTALLETSLSPSLPYYMGHEKMGGLEIVTGGIVPLTSRFSYPYLSPLLFMGKHPKPVFWDDESIVKFMKKMILNTNWGDIDILLLDIPFAYLDMLKGLKAFMGDKISQSLLLVDSKSCNTPQTRSQILYMESHTDLLNVVLSPTRTKEKDHDKKIVLPFIDAVYNENVKMSDIPSLLTDAYDASLEEVSKACLSIF